MRDRWNLLRLYQLANYKVSQYFTKCFEFHANHNFWIFYHQWQRLKTQMLNEFINSKWQVSPMLGYNKYADTIPRWSYLDRVFQHLIYKLIKPTFKHIINKNCLHIHGPSASKTALKLNHITVVNLHKRCYHRALEKVKLMQASAGSPEKVHSYLRRWARWWAIMHGDIGYEDVMGAWIEGDRRGSFYQVLCVLGVYEQDFSEPRFPLAVASHPELCVSLLDGLVWLRYLMPQSTACLSYSYIYRRFFPGCISRLLVNVTCYARFNVRGCRQRVQ